MLIYHEETWPIVTIETEGPLQLSEMETYIATWERWLFRQEPFGIIMSTHADARPKTEKEVVKQSNEWHLANKASISQQCVGIALVAKTPALLALLKPLVERGMKKRMGCPGQLFTEETKARAWLGDQLAHFRERKHDR